MCRIRWYLGTSLQNTGVYRCCALNRGSCCNHPVLTGFYLCVTSGSITIYMKCLKDPSHQSKSQQLVGAEVFETARYPTTELDS